MSFLFKSKAKSPHELVKAFKENILKLSSSEDKKASFDKANEEISKLLLLMKYTLVGDVDLEPVPEVVVQLSQEIYTHDILIYISANLPKFEFEARKDACQIFHTLLRRQIGARAPTVEYICTKEVILVNLVEGYACQDASLICGMVLRECIRHEPLAQILLNDPTHFCYDNQAKREPLPLIYKFFDFVELPTFDIASDAFASLKELLVRHKGLVSTFLASDYGRFFERFNVLLNSPNYVTRRQSLKLLGEILLDRYNFDVMSKYISVPDHLKLMMNLLRDKSKNIQYEAFHVFKIFVANPNRTKSITDILVKNKEKLIQFLSNFQPERTDDDQFNDERNYLIKQIEILENSLAVDAQSSAPSQPPML